MSQKENLLRSLPGVDILLADPVVQQLMTVIDAKILTALIRQHISELRKKIVAGDISGVSKNQILKAIQFDVDLLKGNNLRAVINGTGVILHTNLGRAPIGEKNIQQALSILSGYSNLEYDLSKGKRGKRKSPVQKQLQILTGADDIAIVNNNAAAVYLCLKAFASGGEAIVSRGELVEIGGSFRVPDIMEQSGAIMIEVGATNRTRLSDYENAITENTKVIFKAHQSNFYQEGFTEEVGIKELSKLAEKHNLIFIYDLGCGQIKDYESLQFLDQPSVNQNINDGADLVLFSGDKLLGGPQCGIIAGKAKYLKIIDKHPLMRAFRTGKLTLSTLQVALSHHLSENNLNKIPFYRFLQRDQTTLLSLAETFKLALEKAVTVNDVNITVTQNTGKCGGGTTPNIVLDTAAIIIDHPHMKAHDLFNALLKIERPIVGILKEGKFLIDVLCIEKNDIKAISTDINTVLCSIL